jgi:hypothetical protein
MYRSYNYHIFHSPRQPANLLLLSPQAPSAPKLPSISCSAIPRDGRSASSRPPVTMSLESQSSSHILSAPLGPNFSSDSITIALKRNYVLVIIADCWSSETECESISGLSGFLAPQGACDRACSVAAATRLTSPCLRASVGWNYLQVSQDGVFARSELVNRRV